MINDTFPALTKLIKCCPVDFQINFVPANFQQPDYGYR